MTYLDLSARLLARRRIDADTGCWLWTGVHYREGYGKIKIGGRKGKFRKVHRVAAMLWLDIDIDSTTQVLHKCDNPPCFNPDHLYGGSNADNCRDRATRKRGREHRQVGEAHHNARLKAADVLAIRELLKAGHSQQQVADRYRVKQPQVSRIWRGESWAHLA